MNLGGRRSPRVNKSCTNAYVCAYIITMDCYIPSLVLNLEPNLTCAFEHSLNEVAYLKRTCYFIDTVAAIPVTCIVKYHRQPGVNTKLFE